MRAEDNIRDSLIPEDNVLNYERNSTIKLALMIIMNSCNNSIVNSNLDLERRRITSVKFTSEGDRESRIRANSTSREGSSNV